MTHPVTIGDAPRHLRYSVALNFRVNKNSRVEVLVVVPTTVPTYQLAYEIQKRGRKKGTKCSLTCRETSKHASNEKISTKQKGNRVYNLKILMR